MKINSIVLVVILILILFTCLTQEHFKTNLQIDPAKIIQDIGKGWHPKPTLVSKELYNIAHY